MNATFHHIAISVRDMASMVRFYRDLLGFTVDWDMDHRGGESLSTVVGMPQAEAHMVMLEGFGMRIELFHYYEPRGVASPASRQCDFGLTHFALQVRRIHEIFERLVVAGVRFNCPPENLRPGVWATYMQDPEDNTIELVQYGDS
jgi:catechol 2,3-dioxygenase-like lactoylglutathione lyase family enzyme